MKTLSFLARSFFRRGYRSSPGTVALWLYALAGLADGALMPFFALWAQREAHVPTKYIGVLLACYAGGELLATPLLGGIADRVGRRPVLLCSTLGIGLGFLLLGHLHGAWLIALCLIGIGIFECALHPTIATVIADTAAPDQLRNHYSLASIASSIGRVAGPALGALLARISLGAVFTSGGISMLCAATLVVVMLPETMPHDAARSDDAQDDDEEEESLAALLPAFKDRRLAMLLLWFTAIEIADGWTEVVIPLAAHAAHALSVSEVGMLFTYGAAIAAVLQWPVTRWLSKIEGFVWFIAGGVAVAAGFLLLLIRIDVLTLVAGVTLFSFAQVLIGPLVPVTVNELAPPSARATYMAAISTANDLKDSLGPASGVYLYAVSARLPWLLGLPVALVSAFALAMTVRQRERNKASHASPVGASEEGKPPLFVNFR